MPLSPAVDEPVADAPHVDHEPAAAPRLSLLPQPRGVRVQRARGRADRKPHTPRRSSSRVNTRVGSSASARSSANSFLDRWIGVAVAAAPRARTHRSRAARRAAARPPGRRRGAATRGDPRPQLGIAEGLDDVIVSAALEAPQAIELAGPAGEDDHRQVGIDPARAAIGDADVAQQVEPVAVGQAEVDDARSGV